MKKMFLPVTMIIALISCQNNHKDVDDPGWDDGKDANKQITVMTYNVRYCIPYLATPAAPDYDAVAAVIKKGKADVVFLQEVDRFTTRSGKVDQLAELAKRTNMPFSYYGKTHDTFLVGGGELGIAFLSKYNLSDIKQTEYPAVAGEPSPRILIQATIRVNDRLVTVACTHLGLTQEVREVQVADLINKLSASPYPVIFGGDLNALPESSIITSLLNNGFVKTNRLTTNTIESDKPTRQIDYIMYRPAEKLKVISHTVLPDAVSDHLAVVAVLELQ